MQRWAKGYSQSQLDQAQDRYGLRFPPDLVALFLDRRPANGYDWDHEDRRIREMLDWPYRTLMDEIDDGSWWPAWGERPPRSEEQAEVLRAALVRAPRLIPLVGHRFLPATPCKAGNPVFSMVGFDTIYYGANLDEYFSNEFGGKHVIGIARHIPFWSDIVENSDSAYPSAT
jgi:hypothetical protein